MSTERDSQTRLNLNVFFQRNRIESRFLVSLNFITVTLSARDTVPLVRGPAIASQLALTILLFLQISFSPAISAADYAEIKIELNSTWESSSKTNVHSLLATCVVNTNDWFISGDFLQNAHIDYWPVGTNVVERRVITTSMYLQQAREFISEKVLGHKPSNALAHSYPRAGQTFNAIHPWQRPFGYGVERVIWLAYCSGTFLGREGRQIPMPLGPASLASRYSDETVVLERSCGLPKSVKLFSTSGKLVCDYQVLRTTNFLGRVLPFEFRLIQYGNPASGQARPGSKTIIVGKVTSIKNGSKPTLPEEARDELAK